MCGIAGYIGEEKRIHFLIDTLQRLEYRGYDSCGLAVLRGGKVFSRKMKGKIVRLKGTLKDDFKFSLGITHTRWATHGVPNQQNAHPHYDCDRNIFLVHNGIIENYQELKKLLIKKGHRFCSQTDTEVIAHLLEEFTRKFPFDEAFRRTVQALEGSFAIVTFHRRRPALFFARKDSPLIIGELKEGFLLASDIPAVVDKTNRIINLDDGWLGKIEKGRLQIFEFTGARIKPRVETTSVSAAHISKQHFRHFMLKEIFEQPRVSASLLAHYVKGKKVNPGPLNIPQKFFRSLRKIYIFACGTAYHAGFVAKYFLEQFCNVDVEVTVSSEARYRKISFGRDSLVIAISQSGETADTLAAVKEARKQGVYVLGVCNVLGSTLTKESTDLLYTFAGPEIGVASTKAYTAQVFVLFLFSLYLASLKRTVTPQVVKSLLDEMRKIPQYQEQVLKHTPIIEKIAGRFSRFGCFLFLGRGINYPSALEGALKLKEISYIPAEGYPAGEMKHGPIALIDEYRAVVCIALKDHLYPKMISNIQEIRARKGKVLGIVTEGDKEISTLAHATISLPQMKNEYLSPLIVALPLQLFAYFVAKNLGCEIDQPRNLAKSVTVE